MRTGRTFYNLIAVIVLIAATLIALYSGVGISYAATTSYSDVMDDLRQDSNFNVADYPAVVNDYSLKVIQIAESVDGELFVYVYQPAGRSKKLTATSLNMSLSDSANGTKLYNLTLLNNAGIFQKYRVNGVRVSSDEVRYYNITSIYRKYDSGIDSGADINGNTNEIAFAVAQLWTAKTDVNNNVLYAMTTPKVVTITDIYSSFIRYRSGYWYTWGDATDAHYVAFNADYNIDRLFEAEVYFEFNQVTHHHANMSGKDTYKRGEVSPLCVELSEIDKAHNKITGFGGVRHSWERIQSVDDFISTENDLPVNSKEKLQDKQWILRFKETAYSKVIPNVVDQFTYDEYYSEINNVSILRLYFESDGTVYNLGAVSNKVQTDNPYPSPTPEQPTISIIEKIKKQPWCVWLIAGLVIFFIVLAVLAIFKPQLRPVIKEILIILCCIIFSPFILLYYIIKGIAALFRNRKDKSAKAKTTKSKQRAGKSKKKLR